MSVPVSSLAMIRSGITQSVNIQGNELSLVLKKEYTARDVNELAFQKGIVLSHLETRKKSLESQFLELVK